MDHVNYPHEAGYLYDCPACEAECFCNHDPALAPCVWCGENCGCAEEEA